MRVARLLTYFFLVAVVVAASFWVQQGAAQPGLSLTYIANEGVLLEAGGQKVLIDALFRGLAGYLRPDAATRAAMESGRGPFAGVDLVLATHYHADHFDPQAVCAHLSSNAGAAFVAVGQVIEAFRQAGCQIPQNEQRVFEITPQWGQRKDTSAGGIEVAVLRLRHGATMNAGFLLNLGGKKILHLGDSDGTVENFDPFDLEREGIDVALVPYWYALDGEGREVIRRHIRSKQLVFFHIPGDNPDREAVREHMKAEGGRAGLAARIRKDFPGAILLLEPMARFSF